MSHPNAFYVGDELFHGSSPLATKVTIAAFVKPAGGRQLVRVRFPDGSYRNVGFDTLKRTSWPKMDRWLEERVEAHIRRQEGRR